MKLQRHRWLCLISLSLLLLFWFAHLITRDAPSPVRSPARSPAPSPAPSPAAPVTGIQGYTRIRPGKMDQLLDLHCNRCALISSSGQMLGASAGEEIDEMGCVIRMNNAPTRGFEKDVGNRTTVRVVSHTSVPLLVKDESYYFQQSANTTYVFWGPERHMRRDGQGRVFNTLQKAAKKYPNVQMYVVTRDKVQDCDNVFQKETGKNRIKTGAYLSTGFFTMTLAVDMCDSIQVYGMIDDKYCKRTRGGVPYHYYEKGKFDECKTYRLHENASRGGHRFITEKAIYAKWAKLHKIEFKRPSWNL